MNKWLIFSVFLLLNQKTLFAQGENWLKQLLLDKDPLVSRVIDSFENYRVQICYTRIDRDKSNDPQFIHYKFGIADNRYRYPASTVKLPVALLALEEINALPYENVTMHTPMITGSDREPQIAAHLDSTTTHGFPSVSQYIKKLLVVSDNDAYNRLFEFLGQDKINAKLWKKGFSRAKIVHRLSSPAFDKEENCWINPIFFLDRDTFTINKTSAYSCIDQDKFLQIQSYEELVQGNGYINSNGILVNKPFDFSYKNTLDLNILHQIVHSIFFSDTMWNLTLEQKELVIRSMGIRPAESHSPTYNYADNYCTFLIYGDTDGKIPNHVRIFNKVGWAYGYLTDAAYIVDFKNNIDFILSASVYVNKNGIFNDDQYEYESIGLPFLAAVGRIIYNYELNRVRRVKPDLSQIKALFSWN